MPSVFISGIIGGMNNTLNTQPWYQRLHFQILAAMLLGTLLGAVGGETAATYLGWMGTMFIRLLRMVIVPLILSSIVSGVTAVGGGKSLGRLGAKTFIYYISTSLLAIVVGLVLVNIIRPGVGADLAGTVTRTLPELQTPGSLGEIFFRLIPTNPFAAMVQGDMLAIIFFALLVGVAITQLPEARRVRMRSGF